MLDILILGWMSTAFVRFYNDFTQEKIPGAYILKALPVYDIISVYRLFVYRYERGG